MKKSSKLYNVFKSGPRKGQPKTLQDRVIRFLEEALGAKEHPSKTKYRKFSHSTEKFGIFTFVGPNGAVRVGMTVSASYSKTDFYHKLITEWERENNLT